MPFVALLWVLLAAGCPAAVYPALRTGATAGAAGVMFLLVMVQILLNDIRDRESDAASGTDSVPVLLGERAARVMGVLFCLLALAASAAMHQFALTMGAGFSLILTAGYRRRDDGLWQPLIEAMGMVPP